MLEHSKQTEGKKPKTERGQIRAVERNKSIEGLRGISMIIIITYHLLYKYTVNHATSWSCTEIIKQIPLFGHFGEFGVSIFLVISSYFLYSGNSKNAFTLWSYFKAKFLRLWPVYAIAVSLTFIVTHMLPIDDYQRSVSDYLLNVSWLNGFIGTPYIDGTHWYMTALVSFIIVVGLLRLLKIDYKVETYLIWVCLAGGSKAIAEIVHRTVSIQPLEMLFTGIYKVLGGGFVGIACIGIVYHILRDRKYTLSRKEWITVIVLGGVCIAYTIVTTSIWRVIFLVPAILLVELCLSEKAAFLKTKWLLWLGRISYPLYLIHQQIGYTFQNTLVSLNNGQYSLLFFTGSVIIISLLAQLINVIENILLFMLRERTSNDNNYLIRRSKEE